MKNEVSHLKLHIWTMVYRFNRILKFCYKYMQLWLSNGRNALTYLYALYAKYVLRCGTPLLADSSLISSRWARDLFVHWEASEIRPWGLWRRLLDCGSPPSSPKEAPSTRELPNYDEERRKRQAGPALYGFNVSRYIFGAELIKGIIFQSLRSIFITIIFYILFAYIIAYIIHCFVTSLFFKDMDLRRFKQ